MIGRSIATRCLVLLLIQIAACDDACGVTIVEPSPFSVRARDANGEITVRFAYDCSSPAQERMRLRVEHFDESHAGEGRGVLELAPPLPAAGSAFALPLDAGFHVLRAALVPDAAEAAPPLPLLPIERAPEFAFQVAPDASAAAALTAARADALASSADSSGDDAATFTHALALLESRALDAGSIKLAALVARDDDGARFARACAVVAGAGDDDDICWRLLGAALRAAWVEPSMGAPRAPYPAAQLRAPARLPRVDMEQLAGELSTPLNRTARLSAPFVVAGAGAALPLGGVARAAVDAAAPGAGRGPRARAAADELIARLDARFGTSHAELYPAHGGLRVPAALGASPANLSAALARVRGGGYVHWYARSPAQWRAVLAALGAGGGLSPVAHAEDEAAWLACLRAEDDESDDMAAAFVAMLRWWVVYAGFAGAGMFPHVDRHRTAAWQLQLSGAKRWRLCAPGAASEHAFYSPRDPSGHARTSAGVGFMAGADAEAAAVRELPDLDGTRAFAVDYARRPLFRAARCYDDVVRAGEAVYYPPDWWHETVNVVSDTAAHGNATAHAGAIDSSEAPPPLSIAISGLIVNEVSAALVERQLEWECFHGASDTCGLPGMCRALRSRCFARWRELYPLPVSAGAPRPDL